MKRIIRVLLILALLGAAAFAVAVIVQKQKDKDNKTTEQVPVIVQDPVTGQPTQSGEHTNPTPTPVAPVAVPVAPAESEPAPVAMTPPPTTPSPKPVVTGPRVFQSTTGLRVSISASWHPQEEYRSGVTYTAFYNTRNEVVASVEVYANSGNTLDLIEQQLSASPSVTNMRRITAAGCAALQYDTAQGTMVVFVRNAYTYYISGQLATDFSKLSF